MSTPQVKAPTKKAFHFPKGATEAAPAPAPAKRGAKASKKTAKPAEQTKAAATTPKTAKKPAAKAPVAKKAGKTPTVEAAAAKKTEKTVASQPNADAKARRVKKEKVVRDSFTMPKSDYAKIAALKEKCQKNGVRVKKSELLRAALAMLDAAPEKRLVEAIKALETVKTGRPANA
ncbi:MULTISPECIES: hypothetical protein [unclassified Caballeronia]|uniref:hypothetical protein n=1 Tax=unclassified Caballeronia TaxID=2646786 RepID=UPI002028D5BE|nr:MULTISPECIES: hypothetical protein [unclassified Caballeronia]MDR5764799.1 hypothetical protein [Caballeronia sp. LZ028]